MCFFFPFFFFAELKKLNGYMPCARLGRVPRGEEGILYHKPQAFGGFVTGSVKFEITLSDVEILREQGRYVSCMS